jgi:hypothetical protein
MDYPKRLDDIFEALAKGRHISSQDGELFSILTEHGEHCRRHFAAIGFELVNDSRGFFYFNGARKGAAQGVEKFALFTFIMVDWLSDNDSSIEEGLFGTSRVVSELPHLTTDRYRGYLKQAGIENQEHLLQVLRRMDQCGFVRIDDDRITFLAPIRRIFDACLSVNKKNQNEESALKVVQ